MDKSSKPSRTDILENASIQSSDSYKSKRPAERSTSTNPLEDPRMKKNRSARVTNSSSDEGETSQSTRGAQNPEELFASLPTLAQTEQIIRQLQMSSERWDQLVLGLDMSSARLAAALSGSADQGEAPRAEGANREARPSDLVEFCQRQLKGNNPRMIPAAKHRPEICGYPILSESSDEGDGQKESARGCSKAKWSFETNPEEDEIPQLLRQLLNSVDRWEPSIVSLELATNRLTEALVRSADQKEKQGKRPSNRHFRTNIHEEFLNISDKLEILELKIEVLAQKLAAKPSEPTNEEGIADRGSLKK
ncbi:hypothetical protein GCK72_025360 [Caenorhabditis remanei]|uniref:Uncharacterized protein n=1 Tax=Caenorhabditis remanei TaxID=31234 RepID=A0A6A5G271_CAERE|nr:hypothetical protein GCK72_025360 [Caenorhabditis remanei]KAF1748893.1 hypothetical protein GCK72_025360 [Caenorhabditis remanei]